MSTYTINNAKEDLEGILHGTNLNKVQNVYYLLARAARQMLLKCDPPETIKIAQITNALHNEIYDYTAPSDLKGNKVIDIRPQVNRLTSDSFMGRHSKTFDLLKKSGTFQIRNNNGTKSLRIAKKLTSAVVLNECDSLGQTDTNKVLSPSTMADDATVGTTVWWTPDNATASDDVYTRLFNSSTISHYLKATNFGFTIPTGATITGIKVEVEKRQPANEVAKDNSVKIVKGGTISGDEKADTVTQWPISDTYVAYGSSTDLWGLSWTVADINAADFGFVISGTNVGSVSGPSADLFIDHIRITVYYTTTVWAVGGDASNLTLDTENYFSGVGALNFDLDASGSVGYAETSDMTQVDLSDNDEKDPIWVRVYIPDASIITNLILRFGNDSSNYWHKTITAPHDQTTFKTGWNILRFDWNGATEVGTVDPATIDYLRLSITYDGTAETDIRVDRISCSVGKIYEIEYYSDALFRSSAGTWLNRPTADTDIVNLGEDGYNLWLYECAIAMAQQMQGRDGVFDVSYFGGATLQELYRKYKGNNPSQAMKEIEIYYNVNLY